MKSGNDTHVYKVTPEQITDLKRILDDQGWTFREVPYAHWGAERGQVGLVAYQSGKLVVQGKGAKEFILFVLEPEILKEAKLGYEDVLNPPPPKEPFSPHIGIDESGKGDFFGPLVVAAVFVDDGQAEALVAAGTRDSKTIKSDKNIFEVAQKIRMIVKGNFTVVAIGPETYNRLHAKFRNLNSLLAWGHARALENVLEKGVDCAWALSDKFGHESLIKRALLEKGKTIELRQRTKAEEDIAVAAASILARAEFVAKINRMGEELGMRIPKGASTEVENVAVALVKAKGPEILGAVAKTHFKTCPKVIAIAAGLPLPETTAD